MNNETEIRASRNRTLSRNAKYLAAIAVGTVAPLLTVNATENVPHAPFAQWADVPEKGQIVAGLFYQESEAYHIWAGNNYHNITVRSAGEEYGIDINQGYISLQYGITEKWAADLALGYTTAGWRFFDENQQPQSTTGLMDVAFGVRYQVFNEADTNLPASWLPTLTLRAGAVLPGSYDQNFPFAPGTRSAAIEPEVLMRKHFGWPGLGAYGDALFRWNRTTHNDQYITSVGLFQQIKGWEIQGGYRRLGTTQGDNIVLNGSDITYPIKVRENNDSIEAGVNYTTSQRHIQFGFYSRTVVAGSNTDGKFWVGGYVNFPIGHKFPIKGL